MAEQTFAEGVRPGGLTTNKEIRILLCYLVESTGGKLRKKDLEEVLLDAQLANYFLFSESFSHLLEQDLLFEDENGFLHTTATGHTVASTLLGDLPRSICDAAIRGVMRAQSYAAKQAAHACEITQQENGYQVTGHISDAAGTLFRLQLYMPDEHSAKFARAQFIEHGDNVYKLVLSAFTQNPVLANEAIQALIPQEGTP